MPVVGYHLLLTEEKQTGNTKFLYVSLMKLISITTEFYCIFLYDTVNPPSAVPCPIAGRYYFTQEAINEDEKYATRIRGVTLRPRIQVDCRDVQAEFKSCSMNMDKIEVDAEYCETVDYRGRPIGEYGKFIAVF
ncbi:hypothetical protein KUTeg_017035 [Tegillarca granosa]|uniref:Uncharacterized protein n=1 Tax=Tegillarca granosa TaxID=220873 RepID=A0ABQ9ESB9_TEGGR|nr:hypothetical protein KUTeg_017035 [Tegillarca granosa]